MKRTRSKRSPPEAAAGARSGPVITKNKKKEDDIDPRKYDAKTTDPKTARPHPVKLAILPTS